MIKQSLIGLNVLITRPAQQQAELLAAIESRGGNAVGLPLIEIRELQDDSALSKLKNQIQNLDNYALLIFVSTNAVKYGAEWICNYWPQFPVGVTVVAIGPTTGQMLSKELLCEVVSSKSGMTSEDLLLLPQLNHVSDQRIGIFRGRGGRELLADTLQSRGGIVDYLEVYERHSIAYQPSEFVQRISDESVNVLTVSSAESLDILIENCGDNKDQVSLIPLISPSERVAERARQAGFGTVVNAQGANEQAVIAALESLAD